MTTTALHTLANAIRLPYGDKADSRSVDRRNTRTLRKEAGKDRAARAKKG